MAWIINRKDPLFASDLWSFHYNSLDEPVIPLARDGRDMGHGTLRCFEEADMELVKRAFATAARDAIQ